MAIEYQHDIAKLADSGLQLNLPPDLVPKTQYPYFTNCISRIEGRVETREGVTLVCNASGAVDTPLHTIFRLNQHATGAVGEVLFGSGTDLWSAPLPDGNAPVLLSGMTYDGTPLSITAFRFDADPQVWAIIANGNGMMKKKDGYYQLLGLAPPTEPATASAGGPGLLNSSGGTGYDWRYTYVNPITQSESNPSPSTADPSSPPETRRPTAFINPDGTTFYTIPAGGVSPGTVQPFSNPGNAFDGNLSTYAEAVAHTNNFNQQWYACQWNTWQTPSAAYFVLTLSVTSEAIFSGTFLGADHFVLVQYSIDGGTTWQNLYSFFSSGGTTGNRGPQTDTVTLPAPTPLNLIRVRMVVYAENLAFSNGVVTGRVYDISTVGTLTESEGTLNLANESANVCVTPPTDPQETAIRLYRRGGSLQEDYYRVGQYEVTSLVQGVCGAGTLMINDNSSDASIENNPTLEFDNDQPVSSVQVQNQPLRAVWGYDERVLGCGDPNRPESVYFSKRGYADAWPAENWIVVAEPGGEAMNGIVYSLRCFVFSRDGLYQLLPGVTEGVTFTPGRTACKKGLRGRFGLTLGERGIYFWSNDGIYLTQGGEEKSIVDETIRPLFPTYDGTVGRDTNGYEAIDMDDENGLRMCYHNGEIWCDYTGLTSGTRQRLIFDERRNRWRSSQSTPRMQMAYSEPGTDSRLLMGSVSGNCYLGGGTTDFTTDPGVPVQVLFRTGAFDQGTPLNLKEYGGVALDIDPGGATAGTPVTFRVYVNGGTLITTTTFYGSGRQRVFIALPDIYALNIAFELQWSADADIRPVAYQLDILFRREPAAVKHWEMPPNSFGIQGWFHIRDSYITLRSNADVTMTVTLDGSITQTIVIASTSGVKSKIYAPFFANKCKLAGFALDSNEDFRVYANECEVRAKQFVTRLGYQVLPVLGAEAIES